MSRRHGLMFVKRLLTYLAVVLLASIAYITNAQTAASQLVRGEMQCGPTANGQNKGYSRLLRGVLEERTIVLLYEGTYGGGSITYLYGYASDNKKIYLKGEDMVWSTGLAGDHSFSGRIRGATIDPNSFPIRLSGPKNSGQWKRECTISITKDTTFENTQLEITRLEKSLREAEQKDKVNSISDEQYTQLKKSYQALEQAQQAAESQSQRTIDNLKGQITDLKAQVTEAEQAAATAQSAAMEAKNKQLLADLAALEKAHNELRQQLETLKVEYEPLRLEREEKLAAERQRFEQQSALAERLASEVLAFMTQNPNLPELIALLQLTRKLKASITEEKLEPLETSYNQLTAAIEDIPGFAVFFEQQAKAEQAAAEQKGKEAEARLAEEKKKQEEARLAEEKKKQEEAERKRKAEEALVEKAQQLVLSMRQYLVKHMDADDIDDRLADLAVLEKAISSRDIGKIRQFVEASEAKAQQQKEEEARLEAEKKKQEQARLAAEKKKQEEAKLAEEKKKQEQAAAERKRKVAEARQKAKAELEQRAEQQRKNEERKQQERYVYDPGKTEWKAESVYDSNPGETECIDNLYRLREVLVSISYKIPAMPPLVDVYGPGETIFYNALDSKNRGDYAYCVSETKRALDVLSPYANF